MRCFDHGLKPTFPGGWVSITGPFQEIERNAICSFVRDFIAGFSDKRNDSAADTPAPKQIKDFKARDYRGRETSLAEFADSKAVVVAFLGTECPLAKLEDGPRLGRVGQLLQAQGVAFLGIDSNRQDSISEIANYWREYTA